MAAICGMNSSCNFRGVKGCASKKSSKWKLSRAANAVIGHDRTMTTIGKQKQKLCELYFCKIERLFCSAALNFWKTQNAKRKIREKNPPFWVFVLLPSLKLTARLKIDHPKRKGLSSSPIHFQEREMLVSGRVVWRGVQYYLLVGG